MWSKRTSHGKLENILIEQSKNTRKQNLSKVTKVVFTGNLKH